MMQARNHCHYERSDRYEGFIIPHKDLGELGY